MEYEDYEALIELVKQHEEVYNTQCIKYRDITLRIAAWEEIARVMQRPVEECKDQWNKLRNCYTNAMKRRRKPNGKRIAPWRFEEQMSFLRQHQNRLYLEEETHSPEVQASPEHVNYIEAQIPRSPSNESYSIPTEPLYLEDRRQDTEEKSGQELDEIDHFFLSMSKSVKRMSRVDQVRVKMEIHRAVSEAELRQLEYGDTKRFKFE